MISYKAKNITELELAVMEDLINATPECRRGRHITELHPVVMSLADSRQRVFMTPKRNNNIFALIAETLWVLSGRDDMDFLSFYLPRATDFSDDQLVWRASYGPRLRKWSGVTGKRFDGSSMRYVDQLQSVVKELSKDKFSRRAMMIIADPAKDADVATKDYPCNQTLHVMRSNGKLDMEVFSRSMDFLWGSNINFTEFSVLQEMLAYWTKQQPGKLYYFVSSCHMYEEFRQKFKDIVNNQIPSMDIYEYVSPVRFDVSRDVEDSFQKIDDLLRLEWHMRTDPVNYCLDSKLDSYNSSWLASWGRMLRIFCLIKNKNFEFAVRVLKDVEYRSDLQLAGYEYLRRSWLKTRADASKEMRKRFRNIFQEQLLDYVEEF